MSTTRRSARTGALRQIGIWSDPMIASGYAVIGVLCLLILIPMYMVVAAAFKTHAEFVQAPLGLPSGLGLSNFVDVERSAGLAAAMGSSLFVTIGASILTLLLAFPAAYAIARIDVTLAPVVEWIFSLGFLIPTFAILLPVFLIFAGSGLLYDPLALVLFYPAARLPISVLLLAAYLRTVPRELEESAQLDGATRLQVVRHIFLPLARPAVVTVVILNFIEVWNEFFFALVLTNTDTRTLPVALSSLRGARQLDYGLMAAGVVLIAIPAYGVFIVFQERIVKGFAAGAVKG